MQADPFIHLGKGTSGYSAFEKGIWDNNKTNMDRSQPVLYNRNRKGLWLLKGSRGLWSGRVHREEGQLVFAGSRKDQEEYS